MGRGRGLSIRRERRGDEFVYLKRGEPLDDVAVRRIERLAIPPAWEEVEIAASPRAKTLARGVDAAGRTQYLYHPKFRAQRDREKFERLPRFARTLPTVRRSLRADMRRHGIGQERVTACVLTLIDQELFRVGSPRYADEHDTYGVTTLCKEHLTLSASRAVLEFPGKSGSHFARTICDTRIVRLLAQLAALPGEILFQYRSAQHDELHPVTADLVNATLKRLAGDEHTAKDFRTWGGTVEAVQNLAQDMASAGDDEGHCSDTGEETSETAEPDRIRTAERRIREAVRAAAARLENTADVARDAYIAPRVLEVFADPNEAARLRRRFSELAPRDELTPAEQLTLEILNDE